MLDFRSEVTNVADADAAHRFAERLFAEGVCGIAAAASGEAMAASAHAMDGSEVEKLLSSLLRLTISIEKSDSSAAIRDYLTVQATTAGCYESGQLRALAPGACLSLLLPAAFVTVGERDQFSADLKSSGKRDDVMRALREAALEFDGARR